MAKSYLIAYNAVSGFLWAAVLIRLLILYPLVGSKFVAEGMSDFTRYVQSLALLEVVHSLIGIVKSSIPTTLIQISSRLLLTWGICYLFPQSTTNAVFSSMVLAWSITEVIRYSYYVFNIQADGKVPKVLTWLRYTTFYILYPIGAGSEAILVFLSLKPATELSPAYGLFLKAVLVIYVPGFYIMYTHMIKQRKRVFKNLGKRKSEKKTQ